MDTSVLDAFIGTAESLFRYAIGRSAGGTADRVLVVSQDIGVHDVGDPIEHGVIRASDGPRAAHGAHMLVKGGTGDGRPRFRVLEIPPA